MSTITVSDLYVYPVKSMGGVRLEASRVDCFGLANDRRWMVVDENGNMMTQRTHPQMALITPALQGDHLCLSLDGKTYIDVSHAHEGEQVVVRVWNDEVVAQPVGTDVDGWLSEILGEPVRLVFFPRKERRQVDRQYARPGDLTAFTDGFPLLLISQGSLDDLNQRLPQALPMTRFRPNLVVSGNPPYAEDDWREIAVAGVTMRVVKPCSRCVMTTVDPQRGVRSGGEPLKTLATYRKKGNKVMFGQNVIPNNTGILRVGDTVSTASPNISQTKRAKPE